MNQSEDELRKELDETHRQLENEKNARESDFWQSEAKKRAREDKASHNTAAIVFFGGIGLIFFLLLFK